jgi:ribosomal protein S18 acetylase RimI-like enzyme
MTGAVALRVNVATVVEIAEHLAQADDAFLPRLSERVDIREYAAKIVARAERFEAWADGTLVGLVAAYCNDAATGTAYITSVSVIAAHRNQGLASRLVAECLELVRRRHFRHIALEVDRQNLPAVGLYAANGFSFVTGSAGTMRLDLDSQGDERMGSQS